jgi:hypothetical protein
MSPADQPFGYPTTRATIPRWAFVQGASLLVSMTLLGLALVLALQDRHRALLWLGATALTFGAWVLVAARSGLRRAAPAGVGAATLALAIVLGFLRLGPERDELPAIGDGIVRQLERHREAHGIYPPDLRSIGVELPWTRFGGWGYSPTDGGAGYVLGIGDYAKDGFELYRASEDGDWTIDR